MKIRLNPVDRLIQALEGQRAVYAALLMLYRDYQEAMQAWDLVALKPLLLDEQKLLRELHLLERRRLSAAAQLAKQFGLPGESPPRQSELLPLLEAKKAQKLESLGREIARDMEQLQSLREPLLPALESALAFLARHDTPPPSAPAANPYGAAGKSARTARAVSTTFLDKKV